MTDRKTSPNERPEEPTDFRPDEPSRFRPEGPTLSAKGAALETEPSRRPSPLPPPAVASQLQRRHGRGERVRVRGAFGGQELAPSSATSWCQGRRFSQPRPPLTLTLSPRRRRISRDISPSPAGG